MVVFGMSLDGDLGSTRMTRLYEWGVRDLRNAFSASQTICTLGDSTSSFLRRREMNQRASKPNWRTNATCGASDAIDQ